MGDMSSVLFQTIRTVQCIVNRWSWLVLAHLALRFNNASHFDTKYIKWIKLLCTLKLHKTNCATRRMKKHVFSFTTLQNYQHSDQLATFYITIVVLINFLCRNSSCRTTYLYHGDSWDHTIYHHSGQTALVLMNRVISVVTVVHVMINIIVN